MVVWLTGIQYLHVLAIQCTPTVVPLSPASHDAMREYRVRFTIFSTLVVAYGTCTETGSRRGVNDTKCRQAPTVGWL